MAEPEHDGHALTRKLEIVTYPSVNRMFCGDILDFADDYAKTAITITKEMVVDELGTAHCGFLMGAASYAAVCAVNEPLGMPVESLSKFTAPVEQGKRIEFRAECSHSSTRTRDVKVIGRIGEVVVYEGDIKIVILDRHPLRLKLTD